VIRALESMQPLLLRLQFIPQTLGLTADRCQGLIEGLFPCLLLESEIRLDEAIQKSVRRGTVTAGRLQLQGAALGRLVNFHGEREAVLGSISGHRAGQAFHKGRYLLRWLKAALAPEGGCRR